MSNLNELDKSIKDLEEQANELKSHNRVLSKIAAIKGELEAGVKSITENNDGFKEISTKLNSELEMFSIEIKAVQKANEKFIDELTSTNKKLIRELEDALISKLDRLSTEMQNALRSEVQQLEKVVKNEVSERFNQLNDSQKMLFKEQEANNKQLIETQIKSVKILSYVLIGVSVVSLILGLLSVIK
jgi:hypothetical protein